MPVDPVSLQFNARQSAVLQERIRQGAVSGQPSEAHDHANNGINSSQFNYPQANQNVQQEDKNIFQQFGDWCKGVWEKSNPFFKALEVVLVTFLAALTIRYASMGVRAAVGGISGKLAGSTVHPFGNPNLSHSEKSLHGSIESTKKHYDAIERAKGEIAMYEDQISAATGEIKSRNNERSSGWNFWKRPLNPVINAFHPEAKDDISRKNDAQEGLAQARKSLREAQLNLRNAVHDQQEWRLRHSVDLAHSNIDHKNQQLSHWKLKEKECREAINNSSEPNYRKRLGVRLLEIEKYREAAQAEHNAAITLHQKLTEWTRTNISELIQHIDSSSGHLNHHSSFTPELLVQDYADTVGHNDELLQLFQKFNNHDIRFPDEAPAQAVINQYKKNRQKQGYHEPWWEGIASFFGIEKHLIPLEYRKPQAA